MADYDIIAIIVFNILISTEIIQKQQQNGQQVHLTAAKLKNYYRIKGRKENGKEGEGVWQHKAEWGTEYHNIIHERLQINNRLKF